MKPGLRLAATAMLTLPLLALVPRIVSGQTTSPPCNVEDIKADAARNTSLASALSAVFNPNRCSSLKAVVRRVLSGAITAGRKLEGDVPFDAAEAKRQLESARADPAIHAAIEADLQGASNVDQRLLLEAVVMHDKRKYRARDLLLRQLDSRGRP